MFAAPHSTQISTLPLLLMLMLPFGARALVRLLLKLAIGCRAWSHVACPAALRHDRADTGIRHA